MAIALNGTWLPQFAPLVAQFAESFSLGEEGAALALVRDGQLLVDVWAGDYSNRDAQIAAAPWTQDTLVNVFSAGKGLVAIAVMQLVAAGKLDLDAPIAHYWPEFGDASKAAITARMVLCHRSGVSAFNTPIADASIFDWDTICAAIARATPWWTPDTEQGYSPFIYGWILGELVRRVAGAQSFSEYFAAQVAAPLGVECYFGVPQALQARIADTRPLKKVEGAPAAEPGANAQSLGALIKSNPRGVTNRAFANPLSLMTSSNSAHWRGAAIPAAGAHTNARALAAIYASLVDGRERLLDAATLAQMTQCWSAAPDNTLGLPLRFGGGVMLAQPARRDCAFGPHAQSFGHPGAGGSLGFADPQQRLGFGYVTARMGQSILIDPRAIALIDTVYACLDLSGVTHERQ